MKNCWRDLLKPVVVIIESKMLKNNLGLMTLAFVLFVAALVIGKVNKSYSASSYALTSTAMDEFYVAEAGDSLIVGKVGVTIDDGSVVCGTNSVPLVTHKPYVYICGENDIIVLRYSKR